MITSIKIDLEKVNPALRAYSIKLTQNESDAQDLFQETVIRILHNSESFQKGTNFKAWSIAIMKNIFLNDCRKKTRRQRIFKEIETSNFQFFLCNHHDYNTGESNMALEEIEEMIDSLKLEHKTLLLKIYEGYNYIEIAEELDIPLGTIKSRIFWARKRLKERYMKSNHIPLKNLSKHHLVSA